MQPLVNDKELLRRLFSERSPSQAWEEFLRNYSNLFLKIIWQFEKNHDVVMERYLHVCKRFTENNFAILRKFSAEYRENPPKLSTWLAAIVRNICVDLFRKEHGRRRYPKALLALSEIDRKVFELYYWQGYSVSDIDAQLQRRKNGAHRHAADSLARIESSLLRLPTGRPYGKPSTVRFIEEAFVAETEEFPAEVVERWLSVLSGDERIVIRLKFWEDLTLAEIVKITGITPESLVTDIVESALKKLKRMYEREV
jgi:DNA-directed RNA polymerase specialized sigma24 family protein